MIIREEVIMTDRERQILAWIEENPMISQQELASLAGICLYTHLDVYKRQELNPTKLRRPNAFHLPLSDIGTLILRDKGQQL